MNNDKNDNSTLPKGWVLCSSKSNPGRKYYFNRKTGKSSWTIPQDCQPNPEKTKKKIVKGKVKLPEKKVEVPAKKSVKRKSDGSADAQNTSKKTKHEEVPTPSEQIKKPKLSPIKKLGKSLDSPVKKGDTSTNSNKCVTSSSPIKKFTTSRNTHSTKRPTPSVVKNTANARLSRIRAELSSEIDEDDQNLPNSPNTSQTEKPGKVDKSPSLTESKCSTQSPNNSLQPAPSLSQFFAANRIISSMKAQLPEEYGRIVKQKDTFAEIEAGICNQVSEYPYTKHPVTPPQFSEASKLVASIKSKLSNRSAKETPRTSKLSANERLEHFRRSLSNEIMDVNDDNGDNPTQNCTEAMDIDVRETKQNVPVLSNVKDVASKENLVLVADTNIFIHELDLVKNVMNSHVKGYSVPPTLLVPWRVINELDNLKDSNNGKGAICKRARPAMDYLYKSLPENERIKVQPLRDANSHIYPCESPDDEILNCCLQQAERGKSVILVSNDKNLCTKALANGVPHRSLKDLILKPAPQPAAKPQEQKRVQECIYELLSNILEHEMRAKYNDLWLHVIVSAPPWSLSDVLRCLLKHWIAVFHEVFPRIEHLITELKEAVDAIEKKASKNISQSELSNFKELCLEVARRCQIIPEYMELAKSTVARLKRDSDSEDDEADKDGDTAVIEAFEGVWTVYSSYCAKLASGLGIQHSIEDKLESNDPIDVLVNKLNQFGSQISLLTQAIEGVISEDQSESSRNESVKQLEHSLKENLAVIGVSSPSINYNNLKLFSTKCRMMLQEAHSKFSQLVDLLQLCKNNVDNNS